MNPIYKYSESSVKPVEIEIGKHSIFLRKDILEEERTNESGDTITFWVYQEARMTIEEFKEYSSFVEAKNALNGVNDSSNIQQLISGQKNGDDNQVIIMEAIADLYNAITSAT